MKIEFKNLGPLRECEVELGDLTIITGHNNTGKTFVTYGVYGLLSEWRHWLRLPLPKTVLADLKKSGAATYDLEAFFSGEFQKCLTRMGQRYQQYLPRVLAGDPARFKKTTVGIHLADMQQIEAREISSRRMLMSGEVISVAKKPGEKQLHIDLQNIVGRPVVKQALGDELLGWLTRTIKQILFGTVFPRVYIASTERTGAAIFQRELYLGRNRLDDYVAGSLPVERDEESERPIRTPSYATAVQDNVEFLSLPNLEGVQKERSPLAKQRPDLLAALAEIVGGTFRTTKSGMSFSPRMQQKLRLQLGESSSAARSLLDVNYCIQHMLRAGDCFMIDEPELNLHPRNQRLIARLIGRLVNAGVKVFLTTHSDYIIRELNTLILLSGRRRTKAALLRRLSYDKQELIPAAGVRFYRTRQVPQKGTDKAKSHASTTLEAVPVSATSGISVESFDAEINHLNEIQDIIVYTPDTKEAAALVDE